MMKVQYSMYSMYLNHYVCNIQLDKPARETNIKTKANFEQSKNLIKNRKEALTQNLKISEGAAPSSVIHRLSQVPGMALTVYCGHHQIRQRF